MRQKDEGSYNHLLDLCRSIVSESRSASTESRPQHFAGLGTACPDKLPRGAVSIDLLHGLV